MERGFQILFQEKRKAINEIPTKDQIVLKEHDTCCENGIRGSRNLSRKGSQEELIEYGLIRLVTANLDRSGCIREILCRKTQQDLIWTHEETA